jgi:Uma2 family endonuclease
MDDGRSAMTAQGARQLKRLSEQDYVAIDDASPIRNEFRDGVIYAMGSATDDHGRISMNLASAIYHHLPERCDTFQGDMRLLLRAAKDAAYYYPDVMVTRGDLDRAKIFREHPSLIIEVLSPSSERIDRGEKFLAYTQIPSLMEYAIVAQSVPQIDIFCRSDAWRGASYFIEDNITFDSIELTLPVPQIYRRVQFGAEPTT